MVSSVTILTLLVSVASAGVNTKKSEATTEKYLTVPESQIPNATSSQEMRKIPPQVSRSGFSESSYITLTNLDFNNFSIDLWNQDDRNQTTQSFTTVSLLRNQVSVKLFRDRTGVNRGILRVHSKQNSQFAELPLRNGDRR